MLQKAFDFASAFTDKLTVHFRVIVFEQLYLSPFFPKKCLNDKHRLKNNVFLVFRNFNCFYHATFTQKHSKEQYCPLHKRVIILYLLQRQYKKQISTKWMTIYMKRVYRMPWWEQSTMTENSKRSTISNSKKG